MGLPRRSASVSATAQSITEALVHAHLENYRRTSSPWFSIPDGGRITRRTHSPCPFESIGITGAAGPTVGGSPSGAPHPEADRAGSG